MARVDQAGFGMLQCYCNRSFLRYYKNKAVKNLNNLKKIIEKHGMDIKTTTINYKYFWIIYFGLTCPVDHSTVTQILSVHSSTLITNRRAINITGTWPTVF